MDRWGIEGQQKCPVNCVAQMSLRCVVTVSDVGAVRAVRDLRPGAVGIHLFLDGGSVVNGGGKVGHVGG